MSDLAAYLETEVMEWVFDGASFDSPPSNVYVGLHTADPGEDGSSAEVSAGDYSRASTSPGDWSVSGDGPTSATNATEIRFDVAQNDWGTVDHVSLWDADVGDGGNCLWQGALDNSREILTDDRLVFPSGDFDADLD